MLGTAFNFQRSDSPWFRVVVERFMNELPRVSVSLVWKSNLQKLKILAFGPQASRRAFRIQMSKARNRGCSWPHAFLLHVTEWTQVRTATSGVASLIDGTLKEQRSRHRIAARTGLSSLDFNATGPICASISSRAAQPCLRPHYRALTLSKNPLAAVQEYVFVAAQPDLRRVEK